MAVANVRYAVVTSVVRFFTNKICLSWKVNLFVNHVCLGEELQKGYDKTEEAFKSASITLGKLGEDIKKHLGSIDNKRNVSIPTSVPVFRPPPLKVVPLSGKTIGDAFLKTAVDNTAVFLFDFYF